MDTETVTKGTRRTEMYSGQWTDIGGRGASLLKASTETGIIEKQMSRVALTATGVTREGETTRKMPGPHQSWEKNDHKGK